ncbi:MAG: hypothetical protein AAF518_13910 [Spirochaetota bacterium]
MNNIFDNAKIQKIGRKLVKIAAVMPEFIVRKTPFMLFVFKILSLLANSGGKKKKEYEQVTKVGKLLNYQDAQYNMPWVTWMDRGQHKLPLVLSTWEQKVRYVKERRNIQAIPEILQQIKYTFQGGVLPATSLPNNNLIWWLRETLLNAPCHWYLNTQQNANTDRINIALDFSTFCNEVEHESSDCKYNIRDISISGEEVVTINSKSRLNSLEYLSMQQGDVDPRPLQHSVFLSLTLVQQACQASYHNWVHFYFNDFVLLFTQSHIPQDHWIRDLLDPHMQYQTVLNNAGLFSRLPNDIQSNEIYDDILFGGNISSWSLDTFQKNIADKCLGYYAKAEHSKACQETIGLDFNLNQIVPSPVGDMQKLVEKLEKVVIEFVGKVIEQCANAQDEKLMGLISDNILKFMHEYCLQGIATEDDSVRGRFKLIVSRYILQAGVVHGLEHYAMYFWLAPLHLPQRIRKLFNVDLPLDDYSYAIDKSNAYFGHRLFTKYVPNTDDRYNWSSLEYTFTDSKLKRESRAFVKSIQELIQEYDRQTLAPARDILQKHNIPIDKHCYLTPRLVGTSVCM